MAGGEPPRPPVSFSPAAGLFRLRRAFFACGGPFFLLFFFSGTRRHGSGENALVGADVHETRRISNPRCTRADNRFPIQKSRTLTTRRATRDNQRTGAHQKIFKSRRSRLGATLMTGPHQDFQIQTKQAFDDVAFSHSRPRADVDDGCAHTPQKSPFFLKSRHSRRADVDDGCAHPSQQVPMTGAHTHPKKGTGKNFKSRRTKKRKRR